MIPFGRAHNLKAIDDMLGVPRRTEARLVGFGYPQMQISNASGAEACVLFHDYYNDEILDRLMHSAAVFASDSSPEPGDHQNPAAYGTFPKFLSKARERGSISLEEVVHKMTGAAAARFRIPNRGCLKEGGAADVGVFD
jgi:dihydroorotase/N-acyl-D-amino-acid deacylase